MCHESVCNLNGDPPGASSVHDGGMTDPTRDERDPIKVRVGLIIIGLVVALSVGLFVVIDAPAGKALMFAVAATAFVRAALLVRWLRARSGDDAA